MLNSPPPCSHSPSMVLYEHIRLYSLRKWIKMNWFPDAYKTSGHSSASAPNPIFSAISSVLELPVLDTFLKDRTLVTGVLLTLLLVFITSYLKSPWRKLPPSPPRIPIVGNMSRLKNKKWLFSSDCKGRFSEVMYLDAMGRQTIVFNSLKSAYNVLERRAGIYSGRPRSIMVQEILNQGLGVALMDYGELWRRLRRAAHDPVSRTTVQNYHPTQTKEAIILVSALLDDPENRHGHFQRAGASVILSILYDYPTLESTNDKVVMDIDDNINWTSHAAVKASFVEYFPWMIHIPQRFAKWKREALMRAAERYDIFLRLFDRVRADIATGGERPSFSASLLRNHDRYHLSDPEMAILSGQMYTAGFETTSTTLMWWTLAMVAFPQVQRRAQAELDAVVGRSRLPTFADAPHLPYVRAVVREVLRWRPPVPFGLPHAATEDDWYEGMFIPKGATCIANIWQCNHDRAIFGEDADDFRPERHLDEGGELLPGPIETNQEGHLSFGFGRRICVGKYLANDTLFISTARILWATIIEHVLDENGKEVVPDLEGFTDRGLFIRPAPYDCKITPRFPEVVSILSEERERFMD
ncbi:cytochrome P450 [Multifurca ochricompacta]|uniref:Cytochrome P450 n=1 Tax=Multifurca ochricompacta TaxID=376703 RepID=A0AAD4M134_9AGAM|nr:cytochrome P450 [Multifurca ochricompacta]